MVKVIVAIARRKDMSPQEFHRYWRVEHGRLVASHPLSNRLVKKYVQSHAVVDEYTNGEPAFDGFAELWFESVQHKDEFFNAPEYLAQFRPDEARFADVSRSQFVVVEEEPIL
jgi:uncharacterized protein (TIGR02118 family)